MSIEKMIVTTKGQALLAKTHAGASVPITRWQLGAGVLAAGIGEEALTALVTPLKYLPIASMEQKETKCIVTGQFTNTGMEAFDFEELGLWATDPDEGEILYAVGEARGTGDHIEAGAEKFREFVFGVELIVDSTAQVTATIDSSLIFASKEELAEVAARDGYQRKSGQAAMGQTCPGGPLKLDDIRGNTVLGGTPAYDAPVSMESVEGPLKLHVSEKNLMRPVWNLDTQTQNGVTCTRNGDVFVLSGTNSGGSINFYINRYDTESAFSLPSGTYTISGMPNREDSSSFVLALYRRLPGGTNEQLANDYGNPSRSKQTFTIDTDLDNLFLVIAIGAGVNVDGVTITPQIEVGNEATGYEAPSNTTVEIPLLGTDGQALEPLRMSYIGRYGTGALPVPDRIIRKDGVWCVERNTAVAELTAATWVTSANYLTPNLNGDLIRGKESHWVLCTHFPPSGANPSTVWTAGIWMGISLAINKESLPSGTSTTQEEMAAWCAAQAEAGTPVLVCYARTEPVYEELHQDVQLLLNTLAVPGGVCSVWFEGDILPSGADIGFPRGDYPSSTAVSACKLIGQHMSDQENPHNVTAEQAGALPLTGGVIAGPFTVRNGAGPGAIEIQSEAGGGGSYTEIELKAIEPAYAGEGGLITAGSDYSALSVPMLMMNNPYNGYIMNCFGYKINNMGPPAESTDAANKAYVDGAVNDLASKIPVVIGSYQGTGAYGPDNPNSIAYEGEPKAIIVFAAVSSDGDGHAVGYDNMTCSVSPMDVPATFTQWCGLMQTDANGLYSYGKNENGVYSWYYNRSGSPASYQLNSAGYRYFYMIIY